MLPNSAKPMLITSANAVFNDVCSLKSGQMKHSPIIETDFTASFIENGISRLTSEFEKTLGNHGIKMTTRAVFIHQSPMVEILNTPKPRLMRTDKCELGDIPVIQSHKRNGAKTYWRAALWQLKKDSGGVQKASDPQFWLYDNWPIFDVYRGGLDRGGRDFASDQRSGWYSLVSNAAWKVCAPTSTINPRSSRLIDAGEFIVEMMFAVDPSQPHRKDNFGRRVFTRPYAVPHLNWSRTIWEIVKLTGTKRFNARKLYSTSQPRLSLLFSTEPGGSRSVGHWPATRVDKGLTVVHINVDASEGEHSPIQEIV